MKILNAFVLELMGYLSLCGIIAILLGVPALWTVIGMFILMDLGVILYLSQADDRDDHGGPRPISTRAAFSGAH